MLAQTPNTLIRVFKSTVQRIECNHKFLSSFACYIVVSERSKKIVVWIGRNSFNADLLLSKSITRKIMYYEFKQPVNTDIPLVYEAGEVSKLKVGGGGGELSATKVQSENAFLNLLEILFVSDFEYFEFAKSRDISIVNNPIIVYNLDQDDNLTLAKVATFNAQKDGTVPRISKDYYNTLTIDQICVLQIGDEWDVCFGTNVSVDVATKARSTITQYVSANNSPDCSVGLLFGRNIRWCIQTMEPVLFKVYFEPAVFPDIFSQNEENCVGFFSFLNCFVPSNIDNKSKIKRNKFLSLLFNFADD